MAIREVHWEVTNACNLRCKHCMPASGTPRDGELTTAEAKEAINRFAASGVSRICFTGGEPFHRADFLGLVQETVGHGIKAEVITNGLLLDEYHLLELRALGVELTISLDGADATTHDGLRGKGAFEGALTTLRACETIGVPISLYVTVTRANLGQLQALATLAADMGCQRIHFSEVTIRGRAEHFRTELALHDEDRRELPALVGGIAGSVFDEEMSESDDSCWIDGTAAYMTATGDLYACTETFQRDGAGAAVGNIREPEALKRIGRRDLPIIGQLQTKCCYSVQMSPHVVLVLDTAAACQLAGGEPSSIGSLKELYHELKGLYHGIASDCPDCLDPDCVGYLWLMDEEVDGLCERGVPIVQVNDGPNFIHSFREKADGSLNLSERYPACSQLETGARRCSIHEERPLVCRLYPVGLETTLDGKVVWVLHQDCHHVRKLKGCGTVGELEQRARVLIGRLAPAIASKIVETYRSVDAVSVFPNGENRYVILQEV